MLNSVKRNFNVRVFRKFFLILVIINSNFFLTTSSNCQSPRPLIIDHDGGIDDFISCTLQLLYCPERVKAITIAPADSHKKPAFWVMQRLMGLLSQLGSPCLNIPVGVGIFKGVNPFPPIWRDDAWKLTQLDVWGNKKASKQEVKDNFVCDHICKPLEVLIKVLSESDVPVDMVETGPCTNIAELIAERPDLTKKINRIYIMGGAVRDGIDGNVKEEGVNKHDGSAEWNIYNNPEAFKVVLESGVPVTLISLDATQFTPIRHAFMESLRQNCHLKQFQFVFQSLMEIKFLIDIGQYMFWDTLTSAVAIDPSLVHTERVKINVKLDGSSMGKTFQDEEHGFYVDLAVWADREKFEQTVFNILSGNLRCAFKF